MVLKGLFKPLVGEKFAGQDLTGFLLDPKDRMRIKGPSPFLNDRRTEKVIPFKSSGSMKDRSSKWTTRVSSL
jgi:hypothetical protein